MRPLIRDLAVVSGLAAAVVISLVIVQITEADPPELASPPVTNAQTDPVSALSTATSAPNATSSTPAPESTTAALPRERLPPATVVLSSGAPVNPRVDRTPRTARPAANPPALSGALAPPPDSADPQVFKDPASVAAGWLSALCWYDYRAGRDGNTRRAAVYGSTDMPPHQDPWTFDDQAWAQITAAQASSACTDVTANTETVTHNGTDEKTVTLKATQVLSAAGTPYQSTQITTTRLLQRDPAGNWQIGPPVTAN